jgi:hypothetical protein
MTRFERFEVTVTVGGLPRAKERAFRRAVVGAGLNFRLPYGPLGSMFKLVLQVETAEGAEDAKGEFLDALRALGARYRHADVVRTLDWNADPDELASALAALPQPQPDPAALPATCEPRPYDQEDDGL